MLCLGLRKTVPIQLDNMLRRYFTSKREQQWRKRLNTAHRLGLATSRLFDKDL